MHFTAIGRTLFYTAYRADVGREVFKQDLSFSLPDTGFAPGVVTQLSRQPREKLYGEMDEMRLEIAKLGVNTGIVGVPATTTGWDLTWLDAKAGYLQGTAFPTWQGNTVITGHAYLSSGEPGPFAGLKNLKWGDRFSINAWGQRYVYEVRSVQTVSPDDTSVMQHEELDWVTLITCQDFDEASNAYSSRLVVRAVLISVEE
jgi:LPXTG-site transpeptidase (sortase) family protein